MHHPWVPTVNIEVAFSETEIVNRNRTETESMKTAEDKKFRILKLQNETVFV
jgi:hypothetical protein